MSLLRGVHYRATSAIFICPPILFLHDELFGQVDVVASYRLSYRSRSRHYHLCLQRVEVMQILSRAIVDSACFVWLVVFSLMSRAGAGNTL